MSAARTHENHLHEVESRWFAIYTNYKREKLVQKLLEKKGIEAYLPIQKLTRHYTRKRKTVELPLINCYVFVKIKKSEYVTVLETEDVLRFLKIGRNMIAIPNEEMELLKRIVGEGMAVDIEPSSYTVGDIVEIISGNLTGLQGVLAEVKGKKKMVVELKQLSHSIYMEVAPSLLRKAA